MKNALAMILAMAIVTPVAFVACDRTVSEDVKTTRSPDGSTKTESKTVTETPQGDLNVTKEKTVTHP